MHVAVRSVAGGFSENSGLKSSWYTRTLEHCREKGSRGTELDWFCSFEVQFSQPRRLRAVRASLAIGVEQLVMGRLCGACSHSQIEDEVWSVRTGKVGKRPATT